METERIVLRPWTEHDAEALYQYAKNPLVGPIAGWPPHISVEDSRRIIRDILSTPETYAVVLKDTGEAVGSVGIMMFEGVHSAEKQEGDAEIGYWIGVPYWGKGLIPEAVNLLLERCFTRLGIKRVWCGHYEGNTQSRRVMEKCGFRYHHTEENKISPLGDVRTEHFTLLDKEDWENTVNAFSFSKWIKCFEKHLLSLFGSRLLLLGIQGSYGRNEQTRESDIDVVVILDELRFDDLKNYRDMIDRLPERDRICGFTAGMGELSGWEKSDLIQLYLDTKPVYGSLDKLIVSFSASDIKRAVLIGACNIYHAASHNFLHAKSSDTLNNLYKMAKFVIRMKYYSDTGIYVSSIKELGNMLQGADGTILKAVLRDVRNDSVEFADYSRLLIEWSSGIIKCDFS